MNCPWSPKLQTGRQDSPVQWITSPLTPHNQSSQTILLQICSIHRSLGLNPPPLGHHHRSAIFLIFWNRSSVRITSYMSGNFRCEEKSNCCFPALPLRHKVSLSGEKVSKWTKLDRVSRSLEKFLRILANLQRRNQKVVESFRGKIKMFRWTFSHITQLKAV